MSVDETALSRALREDAAANAPGASEIDLAAVTRRSRARRLPGQLAIGGAAAIIVLGLGVAVANGSAPPSPSVIAADGAQGESSDGDVEAGSGADGVATPDAAIDLAPYTKVNGCGGAVAEFVPGKAGLVLDVAFPARAAIGDGSREIAGLVRIVNTSTERVVGAATAVPAVTLSQEGVTLWHTNGPSIRSVAELDLDPGESFEYVAGFLPVVCDDEDELRESFRGALPAVSAGGFEVSAVIGFHAGDGLSQPVLVTSEREPITLD